MSLTVLPRAISADFLQLRILMVANGTLQISAFARLSESELLLPMVALPAPVLS